MLRHNDYLKETRTHIFIWLFPPPIKMCSSNPSKFILKTFRTMFIYCFPAAWQSSDRTRVPAGSSSTPGSTYWQSKPDTPPVKDTVQSGDESRNGRRDVWADVVREAETLPQARQWCLLQVMVNSQVQIMHMVALRSGIQMGAFEPKGALSSTTLSVCVHRLTLPRMHPGCIGNADSNIYLLLTSTGYESCLFLGVVADGLGNGLQPLVPLCSWAEEQNTTPSTNKRKLKALKWKHLTSDLADRMKERSTLSMFSSFW